MNNLGGWDGVVEVPATGTAPLHRSVWEISVQENAAQKIQQDYRAALNRQLPTGWLKEEVFYVAATLRVLSRPLKKRLWDEIANARNAPWGAAAVLDAHDFVEWIERCAGVESWIGEQFNVGTGRFGESLERAWRKWANTAQPAISTALVAAGRDLAPLKTALRFDRSATASVLVDSGQEAVALVYCAAKSLDEIECDLLLANALVVSDSDAAEALANEPIGPDTAPLTILRPPATALSKLLVDRGHHVVHAFGRSGVHPTVIEFPRASIEDFKTALVDSMDVRPPEAEMSARASGCSVSVWRVWNLYARNLHHGLVPVWAGGQYSSLVATAVFLGGWNEQSARDREVIERLSGLRAEQFFDQMHRFGICDDPLFENIGSERAVIAPTTAFALVARRISTADLERLRETCRQLFGAISQEVRDHWERREISARIRDSRRELSDWILDGLASTLLRIAILGDQMVRSGALPGLGFGSGQAFVDDLVRSLPGLNQDPRVMASLEQRLPDLAEAAPIPFVEALESLLQGDSASISTWLRDEAGLFGRAFHTGLLWALETLAWSPDYLSRVSLGLAHLAELDPGGTLSNRPMNSLGEIFLAWMPGTSASPEQCVVVLRSIADRVPDVGWRLLVELLPGVRRVASKTRAPTWRDFGQHQVAKRDRHEIAERLQRYVDLALEYARGKPERLADLVEHYSALSASHRTQLLTSLDQLNGANLTDDARSLLWHELRDLIARHKGFASASWAMPPDEIERLETALRSFSPRDVVEKHAWLFDAQLPETGHPEIDHKGWAGEVQSLRKGAVAEILRDAGLDGIHRLVSRARYPYIVGMVVANELTDEEALLGALDTWRLRGTPNDEHALRSASVTMFARLGQEWANSLLGTAKSHAWPARWLALALLDFPMTKDTIELVDSLDEAARKAFWLERYPFMHSDEADERTLRTAIERFVSHGRAADLIEVDWPLLRRLGQEAALTVLDAALAELGVGRELPKGGSFAYNLRELLDWLRQQPGVERARIASYEYLVLPLLREYGEERTPLALHALLADDPSFFVSVICDLYKPEKREEDSDRTDKDDKRYRAHAAFDMLHSWQTPPGLMADSAVDEIALGKWVDQVRREAAEKDRSRVADLHIGKVLFYLPSDPTDGHWPHVALRRLLERLHNRDIESGLRDEVFNSRGVTSRGLREGGAQERTLAAEWSERAAFLGTEWPRARAVCLEVASMFNEQAEMEDREVKKRMAEWLR